MCFLIGIGAHDTELSNDDDDDDGDDDGDNDDDDDDARVSAERAPLSARATALKYLEWHVRSMMRSMMRSKI